jgi:hypothetical protein
MLFRRITSSQPSVLFFHLLFIPYLFFSFLFFPLLSSFLFFFPVLYLRLHLSLGILSGERYHRLPLRCQPHDGQPVLQHPSSGVRLSTCTAQLPMVEQSERGEARMVVAWHVSVQRITV